MRVETFDRELIKAASEWLPGETATGSFSIEVSEPITRVLIDDQLFHTFAKPRKGVIRFDGFLLDRHGNRMPDHVDVE